MANQWFKFYGGEYLSDPKIERLSPLERSCWLTILCMASMGIDGVIEFLTVESLLNRSGIQFDPYHPEDWEKALSVLVKFKNLKMIETSDEGQITVINWEKRQEHNLTPAERMAKSRKNRENVTTNVTNVTPEESRVEKSRVKDITANAEKDFTIEEDEDYKPNKYKKKPKDENAVLIRQEMEKKLGRKYTNPGAQQASIARMIRAGYTKEEIIGEYEWALKDKFWSVKGVDFNIVASIIHKEHD